MANVSWEITVDNDEVETHSTDSDESIALKMALHIRDQYFDRDWTFNVEVNGVTYTVDLEDNSVTKQLKG